MKNKIASLLLFAALSIASLGSAFAQSSPGLTYGQVPTAAQWNSYFAAKQDTLGYVPLNTAGGLMLGRLVTTASTASVAGFNIQQGVAPLSPQNGDLWTTTAGLFVRIAGTTYGPLSSGTGGSFAATAPLAVTFPSGVTTYAINYNSTLTNSGGSLSINLNNSNTWSASQTINGLTVTGSFTATGLVGNAALVNSSTTVNGQVCTLGSTCTISASAGTITVGTTLIASGSANAILYNNGGTLGNVTTANGGVLNTSSAGVPSITATPVLGVAGATAGSLGFENATSGRVTFQTVAGALGSRTINIPAASGTLAISATAPITLSAAGDIGITGATLGKVDDTNVTLTLSGSPSNALVNAASITAGWTGQLAMARGGTAANLTASNGGIVYSTGSAMAILAGTATANQIPLSGSSAAPSWSTATYPGTAAAGTVLTAGTANTITASATPTLGIAGSVVGGVNFANATSGTVQLRPVTGALGTVTVSLPSATGTVAVSASGPLALNATTGALTCATCVTSSGGGAITGAAPISVSAAGVVSISGAALTKTDDTNVTLTLGGSASTALVNATSITVGWSGQLAMTRGGSNASLTASNGGIVYSTASAMAILSGTATASFPLLSGSTAAPTWATIQYPTSATSGGIAYFSSATAMASTAACTSGTTLLHGGSPPSCSQLVYADIASAALATASEYYSATASKLVSASIIYPSEVAVSYGTTTNFDFDTFINASVTLTGNITTNGVSNVRAGKGGTIRYIQSSAGSYTAVFNTIFKFAGGLIPALTTGSATAVDVLTYYCPTNTYCVASLAKDVRNP